MKPPSSVAALVLLTLLLPFPTAARADTAYTKLGRGFNNILFGWGEYFRQIEAYCKEEGLFVGSSAGFVSGTVHTLLRMGAGVYEVVTFPVPLPADYKPVKQPEFVFSDAGA